MKARKSRGLFSCALWQLNTIAECTDRRQRTVAEHVATRPIFDLVMEEERQRGIPATVRWWEQSIDFEAILDELDTGLSVLSTFLVAAKSEETTRLDF